MGIKETGENMTDRELIDFNIDRYMDLQRILAAEDPLKETRNQIRATKAKLEAHGIVVEDLKIE